MCELFDDSGITLECNSGHFSLLKPFFLTDYNVINKEPHSKNFKFKDGDDVGLYFACTCTLMGWYKLVMSKLFKISSTKTE